MYHNNNNNNNNSRASSDFARVANAQAVLVRPCVFIQI